MNSIIEELYHSIQKEANIKSSDIKLLNILYDVKYPYGQDTASMYKYARSLDNEYTSLEYKLKVIKLARISNYIIPYSIEKLVEQTDNNMLKGLLAEEDWIMHGYSDLFYRRLKLTPEVAYRLGLYYERVRDNDAEALKYYKIASKSEDYRDMYKCGFFSERLKQYKEAFKMYDSILDMIEQKELTQPIEMEYYLAVSYRIARLCRVRFEQYYRGLDYVNRALAKWESGCYKEFFALFYIDDSDGKLKCFEDFKKKALRDLRDEKMSLESEIKWLEELI